jgi:hypothetical protein
LCPIGLLPKAQRGHEKEKFMYAQPKRMLTARLPRTALAALGIMAGVAVSTSAGVAATAAHDKSAHHVHDSARAVAARHMTVNDRASLHMTHRHALTIDEEGRLSGNLSGPLTLHLTTVSTYRVSVEFVAYPSGGSFSGQGLTHFHVLGSTGYFVGTLTINHGTGRYAHARATGLQVNGSMERHSFRITAQVGGPMQW